MLQRTTTLVVGTSPIAQRLGDNLSSMGSSVLAQDEITDSTLRTFRNLRELLVCCDDISDLDSVLTRIGRHCEQHRYYAKHPLDVILLWAGRNAPRKGIDCVDFAKRYSMRIRMLSIADAVARQLFLRFPPHYCSDVVYGQAVHVLIMGFSELGKAIAVQTILLAHYGGAVPRITIADERHEQCRNEFFREFPQVRSIGCFDFVDIELTNHSPKVPATSIYICLPDPKNNDRAAQTAYHHFSGQQAVCPPVFRQIEDFQVSADVSEWDGWSYPFSAVAELCHSGLFANHRADELAEIIHEYYRDSIAAQGRSLVETPAGQPWSNLEESYRQASRHQADHMQAKMAAIDCRFVAESESEFFVFYPREVEKLARVEHLRWSADRYLNGWRYGPVRDNQEKLHPELVEYDELSEDMKDLDRYTIRLMPALLGRNGLTIRRNLIVGLTHISPTAEPGKSFNRAVDAVVQRLRQRYPDRTLVFALQLDAPGQRRIAIRAREKHPVALWSLLCESVDRTLANEQSSDQRNQCLELLGCSERRFCLANRAEINSWLRQRADICWIVDSAGEREVDAVQNEIDALEKQEITVPRQIKFDPQSGRAGWNFEY